MTFLLLITAVFSVSAEKSEAGRTDADGYIFSDRRILNDAQSAEAEFDITEAGMYEFSLLFRPTQTKSKEFLYSVKIDGSFPFEAASELTAHLTYKSEEGKITLDNGDEAAVTLKTVDGMMEAPAYDTEGIVREPYSFRLERGRHTLKIECLGDSFEFYGFRLSKPENCLPYSEQSKRYSFKAYGGEPVIIEAENTLYTNDYSLIAKSDEASVEVTPNHPVHSLINCIGGATWSKPGQKIAWEIEVPEDGLYQIGFCFLQDTIIDGDVYRHLTIDGKTPFEEAWNISFPYKMSWQYRTVGGENNYLFELKKGKHTIEMSVSLGAVAQVFSELSRICEELNDIYLNIVMVTGESPDPNRDYELYKQIPDFQDRLKACNEALGKLSSRLAENKINGELDAAVKNMMRTLDYMYSHKYEAQMSLDTYYSYYQTLASWMYDIINMPLMLDKIVIYSPGDAAPLKKTGLLDRLSFAAKRFLSSFGAEYGFDTAADSDASLKIWVNWGRDQVKVLNMLIREAFVPNTGINVKLEQVNASIVQGIVSNNSPDLYLNLSRTEPINLAMRGVLYDLSAFDDYNDVLKSFHSNAVKPYIYRGRCYALPDTQNYYVLFTRDDIMKKLGIGVPETWEEFLSAAAVVQRKNMNTYLPYTKIASSGTVNTGVGGLSIYPTMLMQTGESLYNDELTAVNLDTPVAVRTFKKWTDFYKRYKLNPETNFYQRFRTGMIPFGISQYTDYITFKVTAPEINGKWSVHLIPGTIREDGTVDHSCTGSGTGCAIMNSCKNKKSAWEFIKWWVSEDTQYSYSINLEAILGSAGRVATSNVNALRSLSWNKHDLEVILEQGSLVKELEEVPGSYYVSRSVDQAFWSVYNGEKSEKRAITEWAKISNAEIARKMKEYSDTALN